MATEAEEVARLKKETVFAVALLALEDLTIAAREFDNDDLYAAIAFSTDFTKRVKAGLTLLETLALIRREQRGGTKDQTEHWDVSFPRKRTYVHKDEVLDGLKAHIDTETFQELFTLRWNQTKLNNLAKLGGTIAAIIAEGTTEKPPDWDIEVKERK